MSTAVQLHGSGKSGRTASDHGYFFSGTHFRRLCLDKSCLVGILNNRTLVLFCGDRVSVQSCRCRLLSQSAGHTLEVNSGKQCVFIRLVVSLFPVSVYRQDHSTPAPGCSADSRRPCRPIIMSCTGRTALRMPYSVLPAGCCFSCGQRDMKFIKMFNSFQRCNLLYALSLSYSKNPVGFPISFPSYLALFA